MITLPATHFLVIWNEDDIRDDDYYSELYSWLDDEQLLERAAAYYRARYQLLKGPISGKLRKGRGWSDTSRLNELCATPAAIVYARNNELCPVEKPHDFLMSIVRDTDKDEVTAFLRAAKDHQIAMERERDLKEFNRLKKKLGK